SRPLHRSARRAEGALPVHRDYPQSAHHAARRSDSRRHDGSPRHLESHFAKDPASRLTDVISDLAIPAALPFETDALALFDHPVLLQDHLAVTNPARDLVDRFGREDERGLGHVLVGLALVLGLDEVVIEGARSRHYFRR